MNHLLRIRSVVLGTIEKARGNKCVHQSKLSCFWLIVIGNRQLKSSLEAEVDIIIPRDDASPVFELLEREGAIWLLYVKETRS